MLERVRKRVREGIAAKFELPQASSRLQSLEGMRGLRRCWCSLFTLTAFGGGCRRVPPGPAAAGAIGHTGVDIFFALSGFLMYGIVLSRRFAPGSYLSRRVQRLYPTFGAIFFFYLLASYATPPNFKNPALGVRRRALVIGEPGHAAGHFPDPADDYGRLVVEL